MKVTLEFDTSDSDQKYEYEINKMANSMYSVLWDFSQDILRKGRKYDHFRGEELSDEKHDMLCDIEEEFYKILEEHGVKLIY